MVNLLFFFFKIKKHNKKLKIAKILVLIIWNKFVIFA
jgi:hypothetical protein